MTATWDLCRNDKIQGSHGLMAIVAIAAPAAAAWAWAKWSNRRP